MNEPKQQKYNQMVQQEMGRLVLENLALQATIEELTDRIAVLEKAAEVPNA